MSAVVRSLQVDRSAHMERMDNLEFMRRNEEGIYPVSPSKNVGISPALSEASSLFRLLAFSR